MTEAQPHHISRPYVREESKEGSRPTQSPFCHRPFFFSDFPASLKNFIKIGVFSKKKKIDEAFPLPPCHWQSRKTAIVHWKQRPGNHQSIFMESSKKIAFGGRKTKEEMHQRPKLNKTKTKSQNNNNRQTMGGWSVKLIPPIPQRIKCSQRNDGGKSGTKSTTEGGDHVSRSRTPNKECLLLTALCQLKRRKMQNQMVNTHVWLRLTCCPLLMYLVVFRQSPFQMHYV